VTTRDNSASIDLPSDSFANVARLVAGGFVSQLGFGFEEVDDLQLAIELALSSIPVSGVRVKVSLVSGERGLAVTIGPFDAGALEARLGAEVSDGLDLRSVLGRLVDSVDVTEQPPAYLVLGCANEATGV
jgi:hypothetical protein